MKMFATETTEVAHQGNLRELYTSIKKLSVWETGETGKGQGKKPITDEGQKKRWMEHFEELLNRPATQDPTDIPPANDDLPTDCDPSTKDEICHAIKQRNNGKSARPDSIPAEALETDIETSVEPLYPLFKKIWEEQVPSE